MSAVTPFYNHARQIYSVNINFRHRPQERVYLVAQIGVSLFSLQGLNDRDVTVLGCVHHRRHTAL
jgi:hypothetical protein